MAQLVTVWGSGKNGIPDFVYAIVETAGAVTVYAVTTSPHPSPMVYADTLAAVAALRALHGEDVQLWTLKK